MCMFTLQGLTGLAACSKFNLFLTEPWFGWVGRWHNVSYLTDSWGWPWAYVLANEMHWKSPGFLGDSLEAGPSCFLACPFFLMAREVWPRGWPTPLAIERQSDPGKADEAQRQKSNDNHLDSYVTKYLLDLLKTLFIQVFHYVQLNRILTNKWFILNAPLESKPYIFMYLSKFLLTFSN